MGTNAWHLTEWLLFVPYILLALVWLGWSLIQLLQTPREKYDLLTVCIVLSGIGTALLVGSIGLDRSFGGLRSWPEPYYNALRLFLGVAAAVGIGPTYLNVWRALRARVQGHRCKVEVHDLPDNGNGTG